MRPILGISFVFLVCITVCVDADSAKVEMDRTMTKVIKMLQGMLEKSKKDGETDVKLFAKYQCFCDTNEAEKSKSIDDLTKQIAMLASEIDELKGENGKLGSECAELEIARGDNERARQTAATLREKAAEDFKTEEE